VFGRRVARGIGVVQFGAVERVAFWWVGGLGEGEGEEDRKERK
jgi:hypothetical protein